MHQLLCSAQLLSHVWLFATPWTIAPRLLCPWGFSRQEYWSEFPYPPPGDLPNPGIEPRPSKLQVDSLSFEPPGKYRNTGESNLTLLQGNFMTQELNQGLLHCRGIFYQLNYQGSLHQLLLFLFNMDSIYNLANIRPQIRLQVMSFAFSLDIHVSLQVQTTFFVIRLDLQLIYIRVKPHDT